MALVALQVTPFYLFVYSFKDITHIAFLILPPFVLTDISYGYMIVITALFLHHSHHHDPTSGSHLTTRHHDRRAIHCGQGRDWVPILV
ncbi:hypothetical protein BDV26DRAFT_101171 [Aspergillus bertholletiae]|uniref:Uncharacterized protein n=1 Tax=Aspergillus bertholletiae TaxID=1226010 RepID=A0A5N7BHC3_9EURO|nr:hypothetical protein BDV26DRAFT_101171 [Aspergillus bertholletiae]